MSQRFDSTVEAGELALEDPVEESEASASGLDRGQHVEHIEVLTHVNLTRSDSYGAHLWMANLLVEEPDALMCARPDLWEPWVSNRPGPPGPLQDHFTANSQRWNPPNAVPDNEKCCQTDRTPQHLMP
jgi:hypothetical protein